MPFKLDELAWAAGLFEGEGTIRVDRHYWRDGEKRDRKTPQVKIRVAMTDEEPVKKFAGIFGGRTMGPYQYGKNKKFWIADIDSPKKVRMALSLMKPWLSPRRLEQIETSVSV